jgi:hypothetical protein
MSGVPGRGGPVPKRSNQRHGHRAKAEAESVDRAPGAERVDVPPADESWHHIARQWYESLELSGQSAFYQPSDWATAYLIAESISRDLKPQFVGISETTGEPIIETIPMKGASLAAYLKAMTALLVTEGDRRRARLELERPRPVAEEAPDVSWIDDARARLRATD